VVVALLALGWSDPRDTWLDPLGPWSDLSVLQSNSASPRWWWMHLRGCAACASGHACPLRLGVETAMGTLLGWLGSLLRRLSSSGRWLVFNLYLLNAVGQHYDTVATTLTSLLPVSLLEMSF